MSPQARARDVIHRLLTDPALGDRPLILIGHSLGGLIIKQMIVQLELANAANETALLERILGVVFIATPHAGAFLATLADRLRFLVWPTVNVRGLAQNDPALLRLNHDYRRVAERRTKTRHLVYYETIPLGWGNVVDETQADPGLNVEPVGVDADHIQIAKPAAANTVLLNGVSVLIREIGLASKDAGAFREAERDEVTTYPEWNWPAKLARIVIMLAAGLLLFYGLVGIGTAVDLAQRQIDWVFNRIDENRCEARHEFPENREKRFRVYVAKFKNDDGSARDKVVSALGTLGDFHIFSGCRELHPSSDGDQLRNQTIAEEEARKIIKARNADILLMGRREGSEVRVWPVSEAGCEWQTRAVRIEGFSGDSPLIKSAVQHLQKSAVLSLSSACYNPELVGNWDKIYRNAVYAVEFISNTKNQMTAEEKDDAISVIFLLSFTRFRDDKNQNWYYLIEKLFPSFSDIVRKALAGYRACSIALTDEIASMRKSAAALISEFLSLMNDVNITAFDTDKSCDAVISQALNRAISERRSVLSPTDLRRLESAITPNLKIAPAQ